MSRSLARAAVLVLLGLFLGIAGAAAVLAYLPNPGSPPSVYDAFNWSSTANGFWHVNPDGATARIAHGNLTLSGHSIELDRRVQTDPTETVMSVRIRASSFDKFGMGIGAFHSGTIGMELDADGIKCGRGTEFGYRIDFIKPWAKPPTNKWMYLELAVKNPYPNPKVLAKLANVDPQKLKPVTERCAAYDAAGHLLGSETAGFPRPNAHYAGFDQAYLRTWDSHNDYQIDWVYVGPRSGDPLARIVGFTL